MGKTNDITNIFKRINKGEDISKLREQQREVLSNVRPSDFALAQQNLLNSGCSLEELQSHWWDYVGVFGDQVGYLRSRLPYNHVIRQVMLEHEMLMGMFADMEDIVAEIQMKDVLTDTCSLFRRLQHICEHLAAGQEHVEREEDVLFPQLRKYRLNRIIQAVRSDHVHIKYSVCNMIKLLDEFEELDLLEFKIRLQSTSDYFIKSARDHIYIEDNILYPIALEVIRDPLVWQRLKAVCDDIGYCPMHEEEF